MAGDRFATKLLHQIDTASEVSPRHCPFCFRAMKQFQIAQPVLTLDACRLCNTVWFDPGEFEEVPEGIVETQDELELRGREAEAMWKLEEMAEQRRREEMTSGEPPDEGWKWIPAFLGLPVKIEDPGLSRWPWMTWSLSAIIALVSIWAFFDFGKCNQSLWTDTGRNMALRRRNTADFLLFARRYLALGWQSLFSVARWRQRREIIWVAGDSSGSFFCQLWLVTSHIFYRNFSFCYSMHRSSGGISGSSFFTRWELSQRACDWVFSSWLFMLSCFGHWLVIQ